MVNIRVQKKTRSRSGSAAGGSGFIISPEGFIVTNCHVAENNEAIEIELNKLLSVLNINYKELENQILEIPKNVIDFKLSKWGIKSENIDEIVNRSFTKSRISNNVVELNHEDVRHLLEQIM